MSASNPSRRTAAKAIEVQIANQQSAVLIDKRWYRALAQHALSAQEVRAAKLGVAFVTNETIHDLNRRFLEHDYPTDVITFPLSDSQKLLQGEIVISAEYAIEEAREYQQPVHVEMGLYLVHGILHLCGYDDKSPAHAKVMRQKEQHYLRQLNLPAIADSE